MTRRPFAALALVVLLGCSSGVAKGPTTVSLRAADGTNTTLASLDGTPLVVNLWATWCRPCVAEMPVFEQVAALRPAVRIVGVNIGDDPAAAAAFATKVGVSYTQFTDADGALESALSVSGLPSTAFIDAHGKVVSVHTGAFTAAELTAAIDHLVGGTGNA